VQLVLRNPEDMATRIEDVPKGADVKEVKRAVATTVRIIRGTTIKPSTVRN